jgi:hypothetical protein
VCLPRLVLVPPIHSAGERRVLVRRQQCVVTVRDLWDRYWKGVGLLPWAILCPRFAAKALSACGEAETFRNGALAGSSTK